MPENSSLSFHNIYEWKYNNTTYLDDDLLCHIYDLLDTINEDTIKKNKELMKDRYKNTSYQAKKKPRSIINKVAYIYNTEQYNNTEQHNNTKVYNNNSEKQQNTNSWREEKKTGLKSLIKNVDKFELGLNMELNKLSCKNIDIIVDSIKTRFITYLCDELDSVFMDKAILEPGNTNIESAFNIILDKYYKYQDKLWDNSINKICFQENLVDLYFKLIHKLLVVKNNDLIDKLQVELLARVDRVDNNIRSIINILITNLKQNNKILCFHSYNLYKNNIINECVIFNKNNNYFQDNNNNKLYKYLHLELQICDNIPHQKIFMALGKFVKYFTDINKRDRMGDLYDVLLLSIYDNFKILNEVLQWEPIDITDVERRVNFIIGFLGDNIKFIKGLDTDFYRDIECELDMIKKYKNIPNSIKYKLFDCIDNFITSRNK